MAASRSGGLRLADAIWATAIRIVETVTRKSGPASAATTIDPSKDRTMTITVDRPGRRMMRLRKLFSCRCGPAAARSNHVQCRIRCITRLT